MNDTLDVGRELFIWADQHRQSLFVAALGVSVLLLIWAVRKAVKSGRPDKWLTIMSVLLGFAWSAEAMWEIATEKLHLAVTFAAGTFIVFELMLAVAMMRAERSQKLRGYPGKYGRAAWQLAVVMGTIASLSGDSLVERALRLAVPLLVTKQWWDGLTGDGTQRPADAITWNWNLRRILVTVGLARPGEHDLKTVDRERHVRAIAAVSHRLHSTSQQWRRAWYHTRLRRLAMHADDAMLDEARTRIERVWQAAERTRPVNAAERALADSALAEAEVHRKEAEAAREAEAEAVANTQTAAAHAEAEASRRAEVEAEAAALRKQLEAELAALAQAEAEAEAAKHKVHEAELVASRERGASDAASADLRRRVDTAESAAAEASAALAAEKEQRHKAEATAEATEKAVTRELRRRQTAEAEARRKTDANTALEAELAELRERLAEAQAQRRRPRRTPPRTAEPLMFGGAPVPDVDGVGPTTVLAVLQARKDHPEVTQKELAKLVNVTDRTVRQVLSAAPERELALASA